MNNLATSQLHKRTRQGESLPMVSERPHTWRRSSLGYLGVACSMAFGRIRQMADPAPLNQAKAWDAVSIPTQRKEIPGESRPGPKGSEGSNPFSSAEQKAQPEAPHLKNERVVVPENAVRACVRKCSCSQRFAAPYDFRFRMR